jgi:general secretion pathway protein K
MPGLGRSAGGMRGFSALRLGRGGSALVAVLWVIGILSLLVSSLAFDAHIEARITSYIRKRAQAEYLARSGLDLAELLMRKSEKMPRGAPEPEESEKGKWDDTARSLSQGLAVRGMTDPLGEGTITLDIVPEPARRNVNNLAEDDWERILDWAGVPEELWPTLIDSYFDWKDPDDEPRKNGAETDDYYSRLTPPIRAKNGAFDTVGELLLVKGFTNSILSGGLLSTGSETQPPVTVKGIEQLLTTYGDGRVNVNAADMNVLMTLPGVDEIVAGAIIEEREGWVRQGGKKVDTSFKGVNDVFARIPGLDPKLNAYITTDSKIFRVTSVGEVNGVKRTIWCIARYAGGKMTVVRWREED